MQPARLRELVLSPDDPSQKDGVDGVSSLFCWVEMGHPMASGHGAAEEPPIAAPIADATGSHILI